MRLIDIATAEEALEAEMAIISAAGLTVKHIGFQGDGMGGGYHMYDLIKPELPGYVYDGGFPTFSFDGLKERNLI